MINLNIKQIKNEKFKVLKRINEVYDEINIYLKNCIVWDRTIFCRPTESDLKARALVDELESLTNKLTILNDMQEGKIQFKKVGICNE